MTKINLPQLKGWGVVVFTPRSLSSVMMRTVHFCGWNAFQSIETEDGPVALPKEANPYGYFEHRLMQSPDSSVAISVLSEADLGGRSIKIRALNVPPVLEAGFIPAWALVMRRPIEDSINSWNYAFAGKSLIKTPSEISENIDKAYDSLIKFNVPTLNVDVLRLIGDPEKNIIPDTKEMMTEIAHHIGVSSENVPIMVSLIDLRQPYRWRRKITEIK